MTVVRWTRAERLAQITRMIERGLTHREIAAELGMTRSGVAAILNDPDGSKQRARRERYRKPCPKCGRKMSGCNGYQTKSAVCGDCSEQPRMWTRERVIDAIQRFAAENGRPPTARWVYADRLKGYPGYSSVYRARYRPSQTQPFSSWADAIEAAGFPRPTLGHYQVNPRPGDREAAA